METQYIKICGIQLKLLIRKFIPLSAYFRKEEQFRVNDLIFLPRELKKLEQVEQIKPKVDVGKL